MIRSAFKSGLKRILGVEVKPSPAPPPAWRDVPAARVEPPGVQVSKPQAPVLVEAPAPVVEVPVVEVPVVELAPAPTPVPAEKKAKAKAKKKADPVVEAAPVAAPAVEVAAPGVDEVGPAAYSMEHVQELFDEMVRPALQGDGGDITLLRIEANDVYVRLVGSCSTCPSSILTMKMGVESLLREELPGFGSLIQVD